MNNRYTVYIFSFRLDTITPCISTTRSHGPTRRLFDKNVNHPFTQQSGRSPKVVALFSAININSNVIELLQLHDTIEIKLNYAQIHYNIAIRSPLWYKNICKISFLLLNLVAFSCYTVKIHLEKWLMRCDTNRAIWCDLNNKHISIFCIKHMSFIFRTLQVNKWLLKNQKFLSFCEMNATKFGSKNYFSYIIIYHYMISYGYIIMVKVDSCMIWLYFDCIMQLKKITSYCY